MADTDKPTREDKFFGVTTEIVGPDGKVNPDLVAQDDPEDDIEIEIVDDRPEEDQRPPRNPDEPLPGEEGDDDDLADYGERVEKRIKKLTYEFHEQRRQREARERELEEMAEASRRIKAERDALADLVRRTQGKYVENGKQYGEKALEQAKAKYRNAIEMGDPDEIVKAQDELDEARRLSERAASDVQNLTNEWYKDQRKTWQEQEAERKKNQPARDPIADAIPQPSNRAAEWGKKNPWFGKNTELTGLAFGIHEDLVKQGVDPESEDYYKALDSRMSKYLPTDDTVDNDEQPRRRNAPANIVAPATRTSSGKKSKIRLTQSEKEVADRLGVSYKAYAAQKMKEQNRNG